MMEQSTRGGFRCYNSAPHGRREPDNHENPKGQIMKISGGFAHNQYLSIAPDMMLSWRQTVIIRFVFYLNKFH